VCSDLWLVNSICFLVQATWKFESYFFYYFMQRIVIHGNIFSRNDLHRFPTGFTNGYVSHLDQWSVTENNPHVRQHQLAPLPKDRLPKKGDQA
jgi:hypothetical protein